MEVTLENIKMTAKWKEMRDGDISDDLFKQYADWVVEKVVPFYFTSELCVDDMLDEMGKFINDLWANPRKYQDKYYFKWLVEYLIDYYELNKIKSI